MPAVNKVGTQLLVSPHVKTRAQALSVVRDETVAEVFRTALEGAGLTDLERRSAGALADLRIVLMGMAMPYEKGVAEMCEAKPRIRFGELFDRKGEPLHRFPYRTS